MTIDVVDDANEPPAITGTVPDSVNEGTDWDSGNLGGGEIAFTGGRPRYGQHQLLVTTLPWSLSGPDAGDFTITDGDADIQGIAQLREAC